MMEKAGNLVKCRYCHFVFEPVPCIRRYGKKRRTYVECPRCGNGIEREFRSYDMINYKNARSNRRIV